MFLDHYRPYNRCLESVVANSSRRAIRAVSWAEAFREQVAQTYNDANTCLHARKLPDAVRALVS